jgi:hypothetical protein
MFTSWEPADPEKLMGGYKPVSWDYETPPFSPSSLGLTQAAGGDRHAYDVYSVPRECVFYPYLAVQSVCL